MKLRGSDIIYIRECRQILAKIQESVENKKKESIPVHRRRSTRKIRIVEALRSTRRKIRIKRNINRRVDKTIINKTEETKTRKE